MSTPNLINDPAFNKQVFLVGGAVRDKLLGLTPKDQDWLIVGATARDVEYLTSRGYEQVGADFPVYLHPETKEEYALARVERKIGNGYLGFAVDCSESVTLEDDLARRDLTINSMAMTADGVIIDPYGGRHDLLNHVLRHTSPAFAEDPLRVLRLARFAARYSTFTIAPDTMVLCQNICESGELEHLSVERIWTELDKGLREASPLKFMRALQATGALRCCAVLRRMFGSTLTASQEALCSSLSAAAPCDRLLIGVATMALKNGAQLTGAPRRVTTLYANLQLLGTPRTAEALAKLLRSAGALREGSTFSDLYVAVLLLELSGVRSLTFCSSELKLGAELMQSVKAEEFIGLEGRELGAALDAERIAVLRMLIPDQES